jgi:putative DNA methylase
MTTAHEINPFSLKDAPSLIETVLPVQRISIDTFREREARQSQTLTGLGSYWKGRKPLVLNRACVLASLLPATADPKKDLAVFEMLMGMDDQSMRKRLQLEAGDQLEVVPYRDLAIKAKRTEDIWETAHTHIWPAVNEHLGTTARNHAQLVEQLGIMRFGHRPRVADTFSGSGQIPFEAARLGCDVYASDLNPVACMLTWGAFNVIGASETRRAQIERDQKAIVKKVKAGIDALGVETDGKGWRGKVYLYCLEITCPESGWKVPVLPTLVVSKGKRVVAQLAPDAAKKRYTVELISNATDKQMKAAEKGSYQDQCVVHTVDGVEYRTKISTLRGDYSEVLDGLRVNRNRLRQWGVSDVVFHKDDIFNERLYAIQWIKDNGSARPESEFRSVAADDEDREVKVTQYVQQHLAEWQAQGWVPDMRIEKGEETERLYRERGWTHWHHLFNPRQLLLFAMLRASGQPETLFSMFQVMNNNCRLSRWNPFSGVGQTVGVFDNQALNTLYNYGARGFAFCEGLLSETLKSFAIPGSAEVVNGPATEIDNPIDVFITDPPYGDAVKYEEILEFFIAWIRKNPPSEFSNWIWDSRRALAIKGEDHDFKLSMVSAYKRMAECMPDNGLQIVMFTHQSGSIWADMANIVWASGLRVTAAWYVVTETDSALREGQYVKGTILLVLRKRLHEQDAARDELAYELAEEVKSQVDLLTGLNKDIKTLYRDENLFEDADLQMAGYAAALRVLTRYSQIDGVSMTQEAMRPRVKGQTTMVDELIAFAVNIANEYLVPEGVDRAVWEKSSGIERFYLKMLDMESKGIHVLSNYQNFAKAFKVQDYGAVMDEVKANHANLKSAAQLGKRGMTASEEFGPTVLRSVLYAVHLLQENKVKPEDVLHQLRDLVPDYFRERERITALADYVSKKTAKARPDESSNAMVLRDLVRRERV